MTYGLPKLTNLQNDSEKSSIACTRRTKRLLKTFGVMGDSEEEVILTLMRRKVTGKDSNESNAEKKIKGLL